MSEEPQELTPPWNVTEEEITALILGIERSLVVDMVKHTPHLQQRVFRGFRPSRWSQVPTRLGRDAHGHPGRISRLTNLWIESNQELLQEVKDISPDDIRAAIAELLVRRGVENKLQVLWALRLDERDEIQRALEAGLAEEITAETSELLSQVQSNTLSAALETAQTQVAALRESVVEAESALEDNRRLLQHKSEQLAAAQAEIAGLREEQAQFLTRIDEQTQMRNELEAQLLAAQQQLAEEQAASTELRQSVRDLRTTLEMQIESSRQEETQQQLNKALMALEEGRREAAGLRLKLGKLEPQLENAYVKRDEERERNEALTQQVQRLEHDKEVVIEQKRKLTLRLEDLRSELEKVHRQLREQAIDGMLGDELLSELDELWLEERKVIRDYLHALMDSLQADEEAPSSDVDKLDLWSRWLRREASLVREVLTTLDDEVRLDRFDDMSNLKDAQQLLALRWYLLEYTRQVALQTMQDAAFPV